MSHRTTEYVTCPDCFEGKIIEQCPECSGVGVTGDPHTDDRDCETCQGLGEVETGPCSSCGSEGMISPGLAKIIEAKKWCDRQGERNYWTHAVYLDDGPEVYVQKHHGVTVYALAAWKELRAQMIYEGIKRIEGVTNFIVPVRGFGPEFEPEFERVTRDVFKQHEEVLRRLSDTTITIPALLIESSRHRLYLTGCSYGYGGEGCIGTVAILNDLGMEYEEARQLVAEADKHRPVVFLDRTT